MKIESGLEGKRARVDMVPLLDVLLIVLIFFLYLSLTLTSERSIDVALPSARGSAVQATATVTVTRDDQVLVGGKQTTAQGAVALVLEAARGVNRPRVVLRSDRASSLGLTVELMSLLHRAGIDEVSIEVDGQ